MIDQFNTLVPFLALSHENVFNLIRTEKAEWFDEVDESNLLESQSKYQIQVSQAAFLLGVAYFEAFLADLVKQIYKENPKMLPPKKDLKFKEITDCSNYDEIIELAVNKEVYSLFYNSYEKLIEHFESKLNLIFEGKNEIILASKIRNCLLHNGAICDENLEKVSRWKVGDVINLTASDVHTLGIAARQTARKLFQTADKNFFQH